MWSRKVLLVMEDAKSKAALMVKALTRALGQVRAQFAGGVRSHCYEVVTR